MARFVLDQPTFRVGRETAGPQRHRLIEPYPVADDCGLSDDDAGPVIDEATLADLCAGMNVDPRARVGDLGNDAGNQRRR
jgi:hypothetical protein